MTDDQIIDLYWARNEEAISCTDHVYGHKLQSLAFRILSRHDDNAQTVCSFFIPGYERGVAVYEEVEINGMFGLATENHVVWADPAVHKVFHLTSEDITGNELLKVAQSIVETYE